MFDICTGGHHLVYTWQKVWWEFWDEERADDKDDIDLSSNELPF